MKVWCQSLAWGARRMLGNVGSERSFVLGPTKPVQGTNGNARWNQESRVCFGAVPHRFFSFHECPRNASKSPDEKTFAILNTNAKQCLPLGS